MPPIAVASISRRSLPKRCTTRKRAPRRADVGWRWRQPPHTEMATLFRSRRWWLRIGAGAGVLALALGIAFWRMLPDPLFDEPQASILLARDGTLLSAKIAADGQWRFPPSSHVPEKYRQALLVFEDKRF